MTCPRFQLRRNLDHTADRHIGQEAQDKDLPLRYRLHFQDGSYTIRAGRRGLAAEIREAKPLRIERLSDEGTEVSFSLPQPLPISLLEVEAMNLFLEKHGVEVTGWGTKHGGIDYEQL